jgi:hypothetical protein
MISSFTISSFICFGISGLVDRSLIITPSSVLSHIVCEHMVKRITAAGNKNRFLIDTEYILLKTNIFNNFGIFNKPQTAVNGALFFC